MLDVIAPVRVCPSPDNCLVVLRHIKDVAVPLVHHGPGDVVHLPHYGLPLPFHMKQFRRLVLNIVTQSSLKSTIKIQSKYNVSYANHTLAPPLRYLIPFLK